MIHILSVLTALSLAPAAPFSLAASAEADWDAEFEVPGACDSVTGDCMTGYTSLLQESLRLTGHRHHGASSRVGKAGPGATDSMRGDSLQHHGSTGPVETLKRPVTLWMLIMGVLFAIMFFYLIVRPVMAPSPATPRDFVVQRVEEEEHRIHDKLGEDTYSLAICVLVRDLRSLALGERKPGLKMSRVGFAIGLVFVTIGIQISIIICTKQFVTPSQVADIRDAYDKFEQVMYNDHTYLNANGRHRGIPGYFNASAFADLDDDARSAACNIPLSQLGFLFLILTVWSITCLANLRQNIEMFLVFICFTPTKDDMTDCLRHWEDALDSGYDKPNNKDVKENKVKQAAAATTKQAVPVQVITGLTAQVKAFLVLCVFLPEFCTTSYLLWLGSRWLTATNDFGNIVCNAVAMEFVLQLKCLLYQAFASERNKRDLSFTCVAPPWGKEAAGFKTYFHSLVWVGLSGLWVYMYVYHLQHVLPDYKWDVHQVCSSWLSGLLTDSGGDR